MNVAGNLIVDGREGYYPTRRLTLCTLPAYSLQGIHEISQLRQDAATPYLCDGATGHTIPNSPIPIPWGEKPQNRPARGHLGACTRPSHPTFPPYQGLLLAGTAPPQPS